jgi:hypothetical protein
MTIARREHYASFLDPMGTSLPAHLLLRDCRRQITLFAVTVNHVNCVAMVNPVLLVRHDKRVPQTGNLRRPPTHRQEQGRFLLGHRLIRPMTVPCWFIITMCKIHPSSRNPLRMQPSTRLSTQNGHSEPNMPPASMMLYK